MPGSRGVGAAAASTAAAAATAGLRAGGGGDTHQALEGQLADQEVGAPLVLADFAQCHRASPVPVWLLDCSNGAVEAAGGA